jgi:hypothetical protein
VLFARLGVFAGGFTLEAAGRGRRGRHRDNLETLVAASVVQSTRRSLQDARDGANCAPRLSEAGEMAELRQRHGEYSPWP